MNLTQEVLVMGGFPHDCLHESVGYNKISDVDIELKKKKLFQIF